MNRKSAAQVRAETPAQVVRSTRAGRACQSTWRRRVAAVVGCVALGLGAAACGSSSGASKASSSSEVAVPALAKSKQSAALQAVIAQANKEGHLKLEYSASVLGGGSGAQEIVSGMNKYFGTHVAVSFAAGPPLPTITAKVVVAAQAHQPAETDVFLGQPSDFLSAYTAGNILKHVDWTKLLPGRITSENVDSGLALDIASAVPEIDYNPKMIPANEVPTSLADLLKPYYKGKIGTTPYVAGFDYLPGMWGPTKSLAYMRSFVKQLRGAGRCGSSDQVTSGQFPVFALDCTGATDSLATKSDTSVPIKGVVPSDAVQLRQYGIGIPTNAADPAAATLFAVFLDTAAGQKLCHTLWGIDLAQLPGTYAGKILASEKAKGAKPFIPTIAYFAAHPQVEQAAATMEKMVEGSA